LDEAELRGSGDLPPAGRRARTPERGGPAGALEGAPPVPESIGRTLRASGAQERLLLYREDPDHASLRHVGLRTAGGIERILHALRVDPPPGLARDVLHAIYRKGAGHGGDAGVGPPLPHEVAGLRVERAEVAIVGAARENEPAAGGQHRSPVMG